MTFAIFMAEFVVILLILDAYYTQMYENPGFLSHGKRKKKELPMLHDHRSSREIRNLQVSPFYFSKWSLKHNLYYMISIQTFMMQSHACVNANYLRTINQLR